MPGLPGWWRSTDRCGGLLYWTGIHGLDAMRALVGSEASRVFAVTAPRWDDYTEVFRSGCTWTRGHGKIFYFSPGDQDYPVYHHADVRRVIPNGVLWASPPTDEPRILPEPRRYSVGEFITGQEYTEPLRGTESR